jgi:hypothetical protein
VALRQNAARSSQEQQEAARWRGWAHLIAHIYQTRPLACPRCRDEMRLIAFLTEPTSIRALLRHLGQPTTAPPLAPRARAPPEFDTDQPGTGDLAFDQSPWDPSAATPDPGCSFDSFDQTAP